MDVWMAMILFGIVWMYGCMETLCMECYNFVWNCCMDL